MFLQALLNFPLFTTLIDPFPNPLPPGQSLGGTSKVIINSSGIDRSYLISFPPTYDCEIPTPVIFSFHGGNRDSAQQQELSQFSNPEFNDFAIAVYPQGIHETWQGVPGNSANDLQFVTDILEQLENSYSIDPTRIWASGKSDGGGFCNTLACDPTLSTKIAAFAPVSGAFYIPESEECNPLNVTIPCNPGRPKIPIIEFHGYKDRTISYGGNVSRRGDCIPEIPHWTQEWAIRDGLNATNATSNLTSDALIFQFGNGSDTGLVTQVTDFSIAHDWPSTVPVGDPETATFNATQIIMDFFKNHTLA